MMNMKTKTEIRKMIKKTLVIILTGVLLFNCTLTWAQEERIFSAATGNNTFSSGPGFYQNLAPYLLLRQRLRVMGALIGGRIIGDLGEKQNVTLVAINGYSGSGKSTLIPDPDEKNVPRELEDYIQAHGKNTVVLPTDWFLKPRDERPEVAQHLDSGQKYAGGDGSIYFDLDRINEVLYKINRFKESDESDLLELELGAVYNRGNGKKDRIAPTLKIDRNTVVLVEGPICLTERTAEYFDNSFYFNCTYERQMERILARERAKKTDKRQPEEMIVKRIELIDRPVYDAHKAKNLRRFSYVVDTTDDPLLYQAKTVTKHGLEFTYFGNTIASVNRIVRTDKNEVKSALVAMAGQFTDEEGLQTLLDLVNAHTELFDHIEKTEIIADILEAAPIHTDTFTISWLRFKANSWKSLLGNRVFLKGVDMIATDFDGVLKKRTKKSVEDRFIKVIRSLMDNGLLHTTITGRTFEKVKETFGPHFDWNRLDLTEGDRGLFWLIMQSGSVARSVTKDYDLKGIEGYADLDMNSTEQAIEDKVRELTRDSGLGAELDSGAIDIQTSEYGILLEFERVSAEIIAKHKDKIAAGLKEALPKIKGIPDTVEVVASASAIEIIPGSKGRALARAIRLNKAKKVVIIADSIGTKENPGNDRSMLTLTQEQIQAWEPDVDWEVKLIKVYVGNEPDENVPDGCIIAPVIGPDSTFELYDAINRAQTEDISIDVESTDGLERAIDALEKAKESGDRLGEIRQREEIKRYEIKVGLWTKATYDRMVDLYTEIRGEKPEGPESDEDSDLALITRFVKLVRERGDAEGEPWILDVGTGLRDLSWLSEQDGITTTWIDISPKVTARIKETEEGRTLDIVPMSMSALKFDDESFTGVRFSASLHHLPIIDSEQGADLAIREAYRVLKPEGVTFVSVKAETDENKGFMPLDTKEGLGQRYFQFYSKDMLRELLERNGFIIMGEVKEREPRPGVKELYVFAEKPVERADRITFNLEAIDREFSSQTHPGAVRETELAKVEPSFRRSTTLGVNIMHATQDSLIKPVDFHTDLSLIPEKDLEANLREWALIMKSYIDLPVNFIFKSPNKAYEDRAVSRLKEIVPEMEDRINVSQEGALKVVIRHVKDLDRVEKDEYPVAMAGENISNGNIAVRDFNSAVRIGFIQVMLASGKTEGKFQNLVEQVKSKLERIYKACGVEVEIRNEEIAQFISEDPVERVRIAIKLALPPVCRVPVNDLQTIHENMRLALEMA